MTENTIKHELEELKHLFTTLQHLDLDPGQRSALLPGALVRLQRSIEVLQALLVGLLEEGRTASRLMESEARKAAILEASLDAVITIDDEGRVLELNPAGEHLFGYRREDAVGRKLVDLIVPPRMRERAQADWEKFRSTGSSELLQSRHDAVAIKSDGSEFPVEVAAAAIRAGELPLLTIFLRDVSARKQSEQELTVYRERLRATMAELLVAEEQERRRLAVDLHDGLSQTIALTRIKLASLRSSLDEKLGRLLDEAEELVDQTDRAARLISFELSPPILHDLGLEPTLQWLVENLQSRYEIKIELEADGRPTPTDERTRVILFRSIRELLINAAKHARARRVRVCLKREEDYVNAAIEDDGIGMEQEVAAIKGSGLFSIQERMIHVGGSMRIESAPGKGTRVHLSAPLTKGTKAKAKVEA